jgi:hypothetical protein
MKVPFTAECDVLGVYMRATLDSRDDGYPRRMILTTAFNMGAMNSAWSSDEPPRMPKILHQYRLAVQHEMHKGSR